MNNYISYLEGFIDALEISPIDSHVTKEDEIHAAESKLNASISAFDAVRNSYLSDLNKLRDVYRPVFSQLLEDIKREKSALENLTGSKVTIHE